MWIEEALYASTGMENQRQSVSTGCEVKQRLELKVVVVVDEAADENVRLVELLTLLDARL